MLFPLFPFLPPAFSALNDQKIQVLLQEDKESKGKRERFRKMQEALVKLKRALSLHDARASAEEHSQGTPWSIQHCHELLLLLLLSP